jgi:hypothetical protein
MRCSSAAIALLGSRHPTAALIGFAAMSYGKCDKGLLAIVNPAAAGTGIEPRVIERALA